MQVDLKHSLEVSRSAWFIRLYEFIWCQTTPIKRNAPQITFCALFWGYVFMPLGLLLVPLIYGCHALGTGAHLGREGINFGAHGLYNGYRRATEPRRRRKSERRYQAHLTLAQLEEEQRLRREHARMLETYTHMYKNRHRYPMGVYQIPQNYLDEIQAIELEEEKAAEAEAQAEADRIRWEEERKAHPPVQARIFEGLTIGASKSVWAITTGSSRFGELAEKAGTVGGRAGERAATALVRAGKALAQYRTFWHRFRWGTLVAIGTASLGAAAYGVILLASPLADFGKAIFHSAAFLLSTGFDGLIWFGINAANAVAWFFTHTFSLGIWTVVHAATGSVWLVEKIGWGIGYAASHAAVGIAVNIVGILVGMGIVIGGMLVLIALVFFLVTALPPAFRVAAKSAHTGAMAGTKAAATVAVTGVEATAISMSTFAKVMKLGYVAVKSNTCPRIVFTDEDDPV